MNKMKIGLIGCGKQAPKHINGWKTIPNVELVLADIEPELARKLAEETGVTYTESPDGIFEDSTIQAVDICTPTPSHALLIEKALNSGKDFLCEKPLCETEHQVKKLCELTRSLNRIGMVGFVYRFHPVFQLGYKLVQSSRFDEISVLGHPVTSILRLGGRGSHRLWKHRRDTGGGAINEMLVHMIDLAIWYYGPVERVALLDCQLLRPKRVVEGALCNVDAEDYVVVKLEMKCGVNVLCQSDLVTPCFTQFVEVHGENGSLMASIQHDSPSFVYCIQPRGDYKSGKTYLRFEQQNLFERQMASFAKAVRTRILPQECNLEDSVFLLQVLNKIQEKVED